MRLTLYWRGWDLFDIEAHVFKRREDEDEIIVTHVALEDSERSEHMEPDTVAFGFAAV